MTARRGSTNLTIGRRRASASAWANIAAGYRRTASGWLQVWPNIAPLAVAISGQSYYSVANGTTEIVLGSSVTGGVPPYSYSWSVSGGLGVLITGGATAASVILRSSGNNRANAVTVTLVVIDAASSSKTATFYLEIQHGIAA